MHNYDYRGGKEVFVRVEIAFLKICIIAETANCKIEQFSERHELSPSLWLIKSAVKLNFAKDKTIRLHRSNIGSVQHWVCYCEIATDIAYSSPQKRHNVESLITQINESHHWLSSRLGGTNIPNQRRFISMAIWRHGLVVMASHVGKRSRACNSHNTSLVTEGSSCRGKRKSHLFSFQLAAQRGGNFDWNAAYR